MFSWLRKKEWRNSEAHLLLLSKFRTGNSPATYDGVEYWEYALKEQPLKAIERFINEGVLEPANLLELVDYKFKTTDIKNTLKQRGLKVSGRKSELIQRLIENIPEEMKNATKDLNLYHCTPEGMQLTEQYLVKAKEKRADAEKNVLSLLTKRDFSKAIRVIVDYEESQVFPRGLGIDWKSYDGTSDVELLRDIFDTTPTILKDIEENRLRQLRPVAGMMQLWGKGSAQHWLPDGFETGIHLDGDSACRMLIFHASYLRNIKGYREASVRTVKVLGANDGICCSECRKISGKEYRLEKVPELPYAKCTCEIGCRCTTIVGDFR